MGVYCEHLMLFQPTKTTVATLCYALAGFVLGLFGGYTYTETPILAQYAGEPNEESHIAQARACLDETAQYESEIFFLSCGGIF